MEDGASLEMSAVVNRGRERRTEAEGGWAGGQRDRDAFQAEGPDIASS